MASDPRTTAELDDFNRANEDPLSGGGNWAQTGLSGGDHMDLINNAATHNSAGVTGDMYWTPQTFSGDIEVWGIPVGGAADGIAWALGLYQSPSSSPDGYRARQEVSSGGGAIVLYRVDNGATTNIATDGAGFTGGSVNHRFCLRRIAASNTLEIWYTTDNSNWTNALSHVDSTYTGSFYLTMGIRDNSGTELLGWTGFGGGQSETFIPQIYRRTHR